MLDLELPITLDHSSLEILGQELLNLEGTADLFSESDELANRDAVASDTSYDWPDTLVVDSSGDNLNDIMDRSEGDSGVFTTLQYECPSLLEANGELEWNDIFGGSVRVD